MARVMIVTGGSRGIGAAIAEAAAGEGYAVAVNYTKARERAEALVARIAAAGGRAIAVGADIASEADVLGLFAETVRQLGTPDVLVNNAGISVTTSIADCTLADYEHIFGVNVRGTILCAREAVRLMSTGRGGRGGVIVNVSSISALYGGLPSDVIYAASKGAVDAFTIGLAKEVARQGIRVCGVRPGLTLTEMLEADFGPGGAEKVAEKTVPLGRIGQPEDIANAVLYLASDKAAYMTGAFMNVSGGRESNVRSSAS